MEIPLILTADSYKYSHHNAYPPKTEVIYSYLESRGGNFTETVFFGLQYYLREYLSRKITKEEVERAHTFLNAHFGADLFNLEGWMYIVEAHDGRLPLRIHAVPEGTVVPTHQVLMTIENTDPKCWWLTNFVETLLMKVWYPTTVATLSRENKKTIANFLKKNSSQESYGSLGFRLHDFGYRGVSSNEQAALGGGAHLINFLGTDTLAGILFLQQYYDADMCGFSIPASEHSTMTSWGRDNELEAMKNMMTIFPKGLVAIVSDQYDIYNACNNILGTELKAQIESREGTVVVRPDSGEPTVVVPNVLNILGERFGYTVNSKGYRVLPPYIRVIQGDGVDYKSIYDILRACEHRGWAAENLTFGSGGALLQKVDRDTQKFAIKASYARVDGQDVDVFKDPITDPGKGSKRGKVQLFRNTATGEFYSGVSAPDACWAPALQLVFENGTLLNMTNLEEVRKRAKL